MSGASQAAGAPEQSTSQGVIKAKRPRSNRFAKLRVHLANIYRLMIKEAQHPLRPDHAGACRL